jgi:hypothetical protein
MNTLTFLTAIGVAMSTSAVAHAGLVLYDTLVPPFGHSSYLNIEHQAGGNDQIVAQGFNSGAAAALTTVALNVYRGSSAAAGTFYVKLYDQLGTGAGGVAHAPGNFIATLGSGLTISTLGYGEGTFTLSGLSQPLAANTDYYIVVGGDAGAQYAQWGYGDIATGIGVPTLMANRNAYADSPWQVHNGLLQMKMRVEGEASPVPEPTTYIAGALLLLPFGLQGIRHLRNRKQVG